MLSRRLLRVKVMQMVYAHTQQDDTSYNNTEKELFHSISKAHELYHYMLLLPLELKKIALKRIENGKTKLRPTQEELKPNMKFVNNRLISQLEDNKMLNKYVGATGLSWVNDEDLMKSVYTKMCVSELYKSYMESDEDSFDADSRFLIKYFNKELPQLSFFFDTLENKNIYWNDEAEFVISIAIKTLKQFDGTNGEDVELMPEFKDADDSDFVKTLLRKCMVGYGETIDLIKKFSKNWDSDRVAALDVTIIQLAIAEMTSFKEIPIRVTLNEYIEISNYYSTNKSHVFINGILEKIVRLLVEEGKISPSQLA